MKWISIKEGLPEKSGEYLIYDDYGVDFGRYYQNTNEWKSMDRPIPNFSGAKVFRQNINVYFWQPLPEVPK